LLVSGSNLDCSRFNILAVNPWLEINSQKDMVYLTCQGQTTQIQQDVFFVIQRLLDRFKISELSSGISFESGEFPIQSGLFGYFSYDLKDRIEKLPITCIDTNLPDLCLFAPSAILVQDKKRQQTQLCIPVLDSKTDTGATETYLEKIKNQFWEKIKVQPKLSSFSIDNNGFASSFTKQEYINAVNRIIDYLKAGDIYQANLSQRFETGFKGDAYELFLDLFKRNPASFFSYIQAGDHTVVSTSPERFIKQNGRHIETRPIKGTIARGKTKYQDQENGQALSCSIKDDAELTMIVDLMRNDLSRVAKHGSVVVTEHKRLEPYENVFHLVSIVEGELLPGKTSVDLLKATFPGGSITGCPKIRSMEIIDELESIKRHVYTGSIGYISFHDTMDLSIAIRTAMIYHNTVFFSVGGGIVYDSDPEKEYQETLDKGKTLMESLSGKQASEKPVKVKAWADGKILDQDQVRVSAKSPGFQYGAGLFETIKVSKGRIFFLNEHVDRLNHAWETLFRKVVPDISWKDVIDLLIKENRYQQKELAVKLILAKECKKNGKDLFLAAFVREYVHRLELLGKSGLDIVTYPHPRVSPLADFKTLNYLYYERAAEFARLNKSDEAIILNPDQTVSETNTANIFAIDGKQVIVPQSLHALDGITIQKVLEILVCKGYYIHKKTILDSEICKLPNVILTNSLMGAVKVLSINGEEIKHEQGICSMLNEQLSLQL
ncbi:MAG: aminodeoxychorismate synthase component I, partial [Desulfobacula sp.]|nr:aminodeoxychorismate synthase component I [Desulfobacula sp.]